MGQSQCYCIPQKQIILFFYSIKTNFNFHKNHFCLVSWWDTTIALHNKNTLLRAVQNENILNDSLFSSSKFNENQNKKDNPKPVVKTHFNIFCTIVFFEQRAVIVNILFFIGIFLVWLLFYFNENENRNKFGRSLTIRLYEWTAVIAFQKRANSPQVFNPLLFLRQIAFQSFFSIILSQYIFSSRFQSIMKW